MTGLRAVPAAQGVLRCFCCPVPRWRVGFWVSGSAACSGWLLALRWPAWCWPPCPRPARRVGSNQRGGADDDAVGIGIEPVAGLHAHAPGSAPPRRAFGLRCGSVGNGIRPRAQIPTPVALPGHAAHAAVPPRYHSNRCAAAAGRLPPTSQHRRSAPPSTTSDAAQTGRIDRRLDEGVVLEDTSCSPARQRRVPTGKHRGRTWNWPEMSPSVPSQNRRC